MIQVASVHRFRDSVAVYVGGGSTQYLTPAQAYELAAALMLCAADVTTCPEFSESSFVTTDIMGEKL